MSDLVERLNTACVGHPHARIPWPHRLLHEAAAEIDRLRKVIAGPAAQQLRAAADLVPTDPLEEVMIEAAEKIGEMREENVRLVAALKRARRYVYGVDLDGQPPSDAKILATGIDALLSDATAESAKP